MFQPVSRWLFQPSYPPPAVAVAVGRCPPRVMPLFCFFLGGAGDDRSKASLFWDRDFQTDGVGREEAGEGSLAIGVCIASGGCIVDEEGDTLSLFRALRAAFRHVRLGVAGSSFTGTRLDSS